MRIGIAFSVALLAETVAAGGFVNFDIEKRIAAGPSTYLRRRAAGAVSTQVGENLRSLQEYIINITVGTPGQQVGLTLDTGSSDLWMPSSSFCRSNRCDYGSFNPRRSSTYQTLVQGGFNITYAAPGDSDAGDWVSDSISIGGSSPISNQSFGLSNNGLDVHGVMGLGSDSQEIETTEGTLSYSPLIDNLVQSGVINRRAFSLHLNSYSQTRGSIILGGIDTTKYTGDLVALPLQPASDGTITSYFVTLSKVTFTDATGSDTVLTPDDYAQSVLLDSGTSYTALTSDVIGKLAKGMGAVSYSSQQVLAVPCSYKNTNATINYTFGGSNGVTISVPISDTIGTQYLGQCNFGFGPAFAGFSVLGDTFLRSAYVVFDMDNQIAAMAQAVNGQGGSSNIVTIPTGTSIPGVTSTASASGTQLSGAAATRSAALVTVSTTSGQTSIPAGTPTFNLGTAANSAGSSSNAASLPTMTGLPQVALVGAGFIMGAFVL